MENIKHEAEVYDKKSICDIIKSLLMRRKTFSQLENLMSFYSSFVLVFVVSKNFFVKILEMIEMIRRKYLLCK